MRSLNQSFSSIYHIDQGLLQLCESAEASLSSRFAQIQDTADYNQLKVLHAMQKNKLSDIHFAATTGYGYNDLGRDVVEQVYADIFGTKDALVRIQMISGTHALTAALFGNLTPGDALLFPNGKPYDTLHSVVGLTKQRGSLADYGITHQVVNLKDDKTIDYDGIRAAIHGHTKMAAIQRSKGYHFRQAYTVEEIATLIQFIKSIKPDMICMVDNCYGEFTQKLEPTQMGADLAVGSLIKNIGGGLAPGGGYIAGERSLVENASYRLFSPALGKEAGATLGFNTSILQGLFVAPQVVGGCLKGAVLTAKLFECLGYRVMPGSLDTRSDIVQAVQIGCANGVKAFCTGVQKASPVDGYVTPEPWPMPGYSCDVIMAAGAFIQGSSIELSADAPMRPPYNVYFQGGLSYLHAKAGVLCGLQEMLNHDLLKLPT